MAERRSADSRNIAAFLTPRLWISTLSAELCLVKWHARRRQKRRRQSEIIPLICLALPGNFCAKVWKGKMSILEKYVEEFGSQLPVLISTPSSSHQQPTHATLCIALVHQ